MVAALFVTLLHIIFVFNHFKSMDICISVHKTQIFGFWLELC